MRRASDALFGRDEGQPHGSHPEVASARCAAYGCPLAGSITDSTKGGGVWYCRFHFAARGALNDEITEGLRRKIRAGEPLQSDEPTPTVLAMRAKVKPRAAIVSAREPGSDDE